MGYCAGRIGLIDANGTAAIGVFVSRFALPSLLFTELATLSLSEIDMRLLIAVTIAKVAMFAGVIGCSLTFDYHGGRGEAFRKLVGVSALRAIFCTQSNDFALGLPVIEALFKDSHPQLQSMLYLLSPISLLLLNPIGFLLMGYAYGSGADSREEARSPRANSPDGNTANGRADSLSDKGHGRFESKDDEQKCAPVPVSASIAFRQFGRRHSNSTGLRVVLRVAKTPIVACTLAGVFWNTVIGTVPGPISFMLRTIGEAFTPCALFFTGLSLVGKVAKLTPARLLLPATLTICKVVVLAIVMYLAVGLSGGNGAARGFGFIYGAIPTAPSVLVYAHEYMDGDPKVVEQIAVSLVLCTIFATPVLFVAGILIKNGSDSSSGVESNARFAALYLSIPSAIFSLWLVATFIASWQQERSTCAAVLPAGHYLGWRQADTRVLLLVSVAACYAIGSFNSAACFSSSSLRGNNVEFGQNLHYFVASFCRLAACGAAAAAALLPEPPSQKKVEGPTTCECPFLSASWAAISDYCRHAGSWWKRFVFSRFAPSGFSGDVVAVGTFPRYAVSDDDRAARSSICMRNLNVCCENLFTAGDPNEGFQPMPGPAPPPPREATATASAASRPRQRPPHLATLFSRDEQESVGQTAKCDESPQETRFAGATGGSELNAPLLGTPCAEETKSASTQRGVDFPYCDGEASRERPRTRMVRAVNWCIAAPLIISLIVPITSSTNSRSRKDACGFIYGAAQFASTSAYLALCVVASLVGLKRARRIVDVRYDLLRTATSSSLQRLASSPPQSPLATTTQHEEIRVIADADHSSTLRLHHQIPYDGLPGGADTLGSNNDLAALAALITRENRAALHRGEQWTPPTALDEARTQCSTKLVTAIGHRMMLLIILHALYAFVACCACLSHLAPTSAKMATTKVRSHLLTLSRASDLVFQVLMFIEATFSSSMGTIVFFIFGLTPNQPLVGLLQRALSVCDRLTGS